MKIFIRDIKSNGVVSVQDTKNDTQTGVCEGISLMTAAGSNKPTKVGWFKIVKDIAGKAASVFKIGQEISTLGFSWSTKVDTTDDDSNYHKIKLPKK